MENQQPSKLHERVINAAQAVLKSEGTVGPLELLQAMGFLSPSHVQSWRKGIADYTPIERWIQCGPDKLRNTYIIFQEWVTAQGLQPIESPYLGTTVRGSAPLPVTLDGDPAREKFFATRYAPANLAPAKAKKIKEKLEKAPDLVVFELISKESKCSECGKELFKGNYLVMEQNQPLCLTCADLDHLEFLPSGDATMSRRSKKYSSLSAVVVRFSRSRNRYERQGILATPEAIIQAEQECATDADERAVRREQDAVRRREADRAFISEFTQAIAKQFTHCPMDTAKAIAEHAAERSSGRVGRSAMGRELEPKAIELAVRAHVRHQHTNYDKLLMQGVERLEARERVREKIAEVLQKWQ
jgi:hypothetical protein